MTVLTTRRARIRVQRRWVPGRLRLTDEVVGFRSLDGAVRVDLSLATVTAVRVRRAAVVVESTGGVVRLRCFGPAGVAGLVRSVVG